MSSNSEIRIRQLDTVDIGDVVTIDEKITQHYRPGVWEARIGYYMRRDPDAALVAIGDGVVVGFMLGEVRAGEFGLEEPTGWIEVLGVDPDYQGGGVGRALAEAMLRHFRNQGAKTVRTLVDETMDDIAGFFGSLGFEPSTLRPFAMTL
ncbi:MAG: GNAT family N-acetyltransferase [Thermoanaerobaculia bacterium]|nr:GNAT family N-acetyltransferase [Thermoanaerobaculia bacterium]